MLPSLKAVIEYQSHKLPKLWEIVGTEKTIFIRLSKKTSLVETGSIIAQIAAYNQIPSDNLTADEFLKAVIEYENLIVGGGIQAISESSVISPSCCCGLEEWRNWLQLNPENTGIWLGHNPFPWIEYRSSENVMRIWSDVVNESNANEVFYIDFAYAHFQQCLHQVESDLNDFLQVLNNWAKPFGEKIAADLTEKFRTNFDI
jgi:hypothetical protein